MNFALICISSRISGIHAFDSETELQQFFHQHKKNRDFAIIFAQDGSNGQLNYTIRTRNNNFKTEQIYLNNIYEIANRDIDEYIDSGFLALQRSIDKAYIELTTDQTRDEFKVTYLPESTPLPPNSIHSDNEIFVLISVGIQKVSPQRPWTQTIHWNQANWNICGYNIQFHCFIEHDPGSNGRRKGLWR